MEMGNLKELLKILEETSFSKITVKTDEIYLNLERTECKMNSLENKLADTSIDDKDKALEGVSSKYIEEDNGVKVIKSPMVGVFCNSFDKGDKVFVNKGDMIKKGDTIGIIEAMKLMNEIISEYDGEIVEVCCHDKENVEFGQPLLKIKIKEGEV